MLFKTIIIIGSRSGWFDALSCLIGQNRAFDDVFDMGLVAGIW